MNSLMKNLITCRIIKTTPPFPSFLRFSTAKVEEKRQDVAISKELLLKMRKETGYSYVNCRKALLKFGEENYTEALHWIKEVAAKEGWKKAAKLSNRVATQGLFASIYEKNVAILVGLKCETDFVSKSDEFKDLIRKIATALLVQSKKMMKNGNEAGKLNIVEISPNEFNLQDGSTLEEMIVSYIGKLGENISLNSAKIIYTDPPTEIISHTHPNEEYGNIKIGRYVSFVAMKREAENSGFPTEKLGQQICHHIIGMVPEKLGSPPEPNQQEDNQNNTMESNTEEDIAENEEEHQHSQQVTSIEENESQLLRQPFMFNPDQTIFEYLSYHGANVTDFVRMEFDKGNDEKNE